MANAKESAQKPKEVRVKPDLTKYVKGVSGSGKKTMRTNDFVAAALNGFTLDEVYQVTEELTNIKQKELRSKYNHLNVGMQRMNLGNRIRGAIAKQDKLREKDKSVANGAKLLEIVCEKPRQTADKRTTEKTAKVKAAAKKAADNKAAEKGATKAA